MSVRAMSATPDGVQRQRPQRLDSLKNPIARPRPGAQRLTVADQAKRTAKACTNPDCLSADVGEEDGNVICHQCGTVLSESLIVTDEVQYSETSAGGMVALGQRVLADQSTAFGGLAGLRSYNPDSRSAAESNGKRYINQIGTALSIPQNLLDSGLNVFKLAAGMNFIQGRETKSVASVCLYIACRLRARDNRHMLIDFSDILSLNVFKLGTIYKALLEELRINGNGYHVHPINPENLIWRFAAQLEFGDKQRRVANDAVRILQRMHRDWMTYGRRPAGLCGAALIIAAGMNNFRRTVREMVIVAKVAEVTIMKRLEEFTKTGSSALTVEKFREIDLERLKEEDPPAFEADKKKKPGRKRKIIEVDDDGDTDLEDERATSIAPSSVNNAQLQTPAPTQSDSSSMPPPPLPIDPQLLPAGTASPSGTLAKASSKPLAKKARRGQGPAKPTKPDPPRSPSATPSQASEAAQSETSNLRALLVPTTINNPSVLASALESTPAPDDPSPPAPTRGPIAMTEEISDSEFGPDDTELQNCLLTPQEREVRTRIWTHENRDWIRAQAAKLLKQQLAEANGTLPKVKKRVRRRLRMGDMRQYREGEEGDEEGGGEAEGFGGAAEAVGKMLKRRGYSRKINYEAVNKVYEPSSRGSEGTSRSASVIGASSPGNGNLGARSPDVVGSPSVGSSAGEAESPDSGPGLSMLMKGPEKRRNRVRVTTPGGRSRSTGPTTPAAVITPPSTQTAVVEEDGDKEPTPPAIPANDPAVTVPAVTAPTVTGPAVTAPTVTGPTVPASTIPAAEEDENEDDDDDDDPDDYFHDEEDEEEVNEDEDENIEDILAEVKGKAEEYEEGGEGDYDED